jgi:DNA-binding CsgD family transcriptional regulator
MMAAKGKTNQEIADYFYISISTVKSYLSVVYQKLGITKRSELDKYLNK